MFQEFMFSQYNTKIAVFFGQFITMQKNTVELSPYHSIYYVYKKWL